MIQRLLKILAILIIIAGGICVLQGINVLPGSYMTGDPQWVVNGLITILVGAGLLWFSIRKKQ